jgi:hypothetical protein
LVFDFELLSLEGGDQERVTRGMAHFLADLAFKILMPTLQGGDVSL